MLVENLHAVRARGGEGGIGGQGGVREARGDTEARGDYRGKRGL